MALSENKQKALRGELHHAFVPELLAERRKCSQATSRYNNAGAVGSDITRRRQVELWRDIVGDTTPLPPKAPSEQEDECLFEEDPWVEAPVRIDYGTNVVLGQNVFINFNCTIVDTCAVTIGSRTLIAPNVSIYSGLHPLDPVLRNGTKGPEAGKPVSVGEDCWIGGNAIILPGVTVGKGAVVGAGSVVTKDVSQYTVVAGNPARVIRSIEPGEHAAGYNRSVDVTESERPA
ncbi:hypothetical protein LTR66_000194 [Elasticomyces elasticus]|nr:hypothetical protein LTR50_006215 [Elasticomyces elasticus]KAK5001062.1 hypothetical protein LTR66_000194 [Elasticomyces elasticus]